MPVLLCRHGFCFRLHTFLDVFFAARTFTSTACPRWKIYDVLRGRLMLWSKPMNQRGVGAWTAQVLKAGDWIEVEPRQCHFACWLDRDSLGVVIKAARAGELGGVGRLGASGKTTCTVPGRNSSLLTFNS
ncbi:MAG: hypothetical protein NT105_12330 [Verrucomicrobia bacterium]|nr:hypothetical protein [Verrucomicrobiota bacterium]